jgi:hypothetical protein
VLPSNNPYADLATSPHCSVVRTRIRPFGGAVAGISTILSADWHQMNPQET